MTTRTAAIAAAAALLAMPARPAPSQSRSSTSQRIAVAEGSETLLSIGGVRYVHVVDGDNVDGIFTRLSHPLINDNPDAVILVTQVWNPLGMAGVYNDRAVGVSYDAKTGVWSIYNEDGNPMPEGAGFHVLILSEGPTAAVHTTTKANVTDNYSDFDYAPLNGYFNARIFVTHNNSPISKGELFPFPLGVLYDGAASNWSVLLEDKVTMPPDFDFNLAFGPNEANDYGHVADAKNSSFDWTLLDHPDLNGNPRAWLLVTHNYSPFMPSLAGASEVYETDNIGVFYIGKLGRWAIFTEDSGSSIPVGAAFNVLVDPHPSIYIDDFESGSFLNWSSFVTT